MNVRLEKRLAACVMSLLCAATLAAQVASPKSNVTSTPFPVPVPKPQPAAVQPVTSAPATVAATAVRKAFTKSFKLAPQSGKTWTDTGVALLAGDKVTITAGGSIDYGDNKVSSPDGLRRGWTELIRQLPVNNAGVGALVALVGDPQAAAPFLVGKKQEFAAEAPGNLFLGLNEDGREAGQGGYDISIKVEPAAKLEAPAAELSLTLPRELFVQVPRRVADAQGTPGDMINFMLVGPKEKLEEAFQRSGWRAVDKTVEETVLRAVMDTLGKNVYTTVPMSELFLFGRSQDYGYARAQAVRVAAERHHLRIWRAPFDFNGQPLWIGAGTHDIGFDKDQRNGGVTHKIDPDVDLEREFIVKSLITSGLIRGVQRVLPPEPVQTAKTAHGEEFHSDGRVAIMVLR